LSEIERQLVKGASGCRYQSIFDLAHPPILGDPGATSRDDAIFSGDRHSWRESLFQGLKSPWALFLIKRVPEVSKSVLLIGQKNIFLANQRGDLAG